MQRILGRHDDVAHWVCRPGQQRLDDVVETWSIEANAAWLDAGVRRGEVFLQISPDHAGSVLAWELDRIRAAGYVAAGPWWVPVDWQRDHGAYRRVLHQVARWVLQQPDTADAVYVPKVRAELEPLLDLWPHVLALPTTASLSIDELIVARAYPVHALGVVTQPTWADGHWCSPAEFFHHDLDHARYKVREDLRVLGVTLPDAYVDGSTRDATTGRERLILPAARSQVGPALWLAGPARAAFARALLDAIGQEPDRDLAEAARWLLFELVHEKSLPLEAALLQHELCTPRHALKLRAKCERGFYAGQTPAPAVIGSLDGARSWLSDRCTGVTG